MDICLEPRDIEFEVFPCCVIGPERYCVLLNFTFTTPELEALISPLISSDCELWMVQLPKSDSIIGNTALSSSR